MDDFGLLETTLDFIKVAIIPAVATLVTYLGMRRKDKLDREKHSVDREDKFRDDISRELVSLREQNQALREKIEELVKDNAALHAELKILDAEFRHKLVLFESAHQDLPLAMWLKDDQGRVLAINTKYEEQFLIPNGYKLTDYVGHDDFHVWPEEIAKEFRTNDEMVWSTGKTWLGTETVKVGNKEEQWWIMKYVRYAGSIKIGIAGIAFPKELISTDDEKA